MCTVDKLSQIDDVLEFDRVHTVIWQDEQVHLICELEFIQLVEQIFRDIVALFDLLIDTFLSKPGYRK